MVVRVLYTTAIIRLKYLWVVLLYVCCKVKFVVFEFVAYNTKVYDMFILL